jgi:epoxyqueuosine reductase
MLTSDRIKQLATASGFDLCGVTTPDVIRDAEKRLNEWLAAGHAGEMDYMSRALERRIDPRQLMDNVRSVIMLGLNYYQQDTERTPPGQGRVSKYARGRDYHKVFTNKVKELLWRLEKELGATASFNHKWFVDYGPFMERSYAEQAGLGFIGKNGMLINKKFGSWIFLAEIVTDLALEPDRRDPIAHGHCGACRLCIEACPTDAIISPRVVDSRRCISYLTVEKPSKVPDELADKMGDLVFGCDICQDVCPYNARPVVTAHSDLMSRKGVGEFLDLEEISRLRSDEDFYRLTAGTALTRPKLVGLKRNAAIAARNQAHRAT